MTRTFIPVCPACDKPLVTLEWKGVEIDYCLGCQGVWLDQGELQNIVGDNATEQQEWIRGEKRDSCLGKTKRLCPRCDTRLVAFAVDTGGGTELKLERCPRGHGLWFDGGELETYLHAVAINESSSDRLHSFLKELFGQA